MRPASLAARPIRQCDYLDLDAEALAAPSRGFGDSVAKGIDLVTGGRLHKTPGCGCRERQERLNRWLPYRQDHPLTAPGGPRSLLLRFGHGFGDAVQLTIVLRHLRELYPDWRIDVEAKPGAHTLYHRLACQTRIRGVDPLDTSLFHVSRFLAWYDPYEVYADSPSTKAEKCLREVFGITPIERLCSYEISPTPEAQELARRYVDSLARPAVLIHYQGNSARRNKNIDERIMARVVDVVKSHGLTPVILDWDDRSGLLDRPDVENPRADHWLWGGIGTGDGAVLAALAAQSAYNIGIDSGPGHVFAAVDTPGTIVWRRHHPIHYYCLAPNITHLVPKNHKRFIRGNVETGDRYFRAMYTHVVAQKNYRDVLPEWIDSQLP